MIKISSKWFSLWTLIDKTNTIIKHLLKVQFYILSEYVVTCQCYIVLLLEAKRRGIVPTACGGR